MPGGRLVAQCGGGPSLAALRRRVATLQAGPPFAASFAGWQEPWQFADAGTTARRLRAAGFVDVATRLEETPTVLADAATDRDFLTSVVLHPQLAALPDESTRRRFLATLTEQAAAADPPFFLGSWRLNLEGRRLPADRR